MKLDRIDKRCLLLASVLVSTVPFLLAGGCPFSSLSADAGDSATIGLGQDVVLEGSVSGGTEPFDYSWTPTTGLSDPGIAQPTFTPTETGNVTFTLTVTDDAGESDTDTVAITVTSESGVVIARAGSDKTATVGLGVILNGSATGGDGDYDYLWEPSTGLSSATDAEPTFTPTSTGETTFTLTVTDGTGGSDTDTVTVTAVDSTAVSSASWGIDQVNDYKVEVVFSQNVTKATAETVTSYLINGTTVNPKSAALGSDGRTVTLTFNGPLAADDLLDVSVDDSIIDISGDPVQETEGVVIAANTGDSTVPTISSVKWGENSTGGYEVLIAFDEVLDQDSAETASAYQIASTSKTALSASLGTDGSTVTAVFTAVTLSTSSTVDVSVGSVIQDVNGNTVEASLSEAVGANTDDVNSPTIDTIRFAGDFTSGGYSVVVTFNEVLSETDAEDTDGYRINGINPTSATLSGAGRTITLVFNTPIAISDEIDVGVGSSIKDINGRALSARLNQDIDSAADDTSTPTLRSGESVKYVADYPGPGYQIQVLFSEAMDEDGAENKNNYRISGSSTTPDTVVLGSDGRTATLTFGSPLSINDELDVSVSGSIKDINGRAMSEAIEQSILGGDDDTDDPAVASATWTADYPGGGYSIEVAFSEAMDKETAEDTDNYQIYGTTTNPSSATLGADGKTVTLLFTGVTMSTSSTIDISVSDSIKDINDNAADEAANTSVTAAAGNKPTINTITYGNGLADYTVIVTMDEAMDETTAETVGNYTIKNNENVSPDTAVLGTDARTITLTWTSTLTQPWEIDDPIDISNVEDISGNAMIALMDQAIAANGSDVSPPATPTIEHAATETTVTLTFAEVMDEDTVEAATYLPDKVGVALTGRQLAADGRTVTLTFDADPGDGVGGQALIIPSTLQDINGQSFAGAVVAIPN